MLCEICGTKKKKKDKQKLDKMFIQFPRKTQHACVLSTRKANEVLEEEESENFKKKQNLVEI